MLDSAPVSILDDQQRLSTPSLTALMLDVMPAGREFSTHSPRKEAPRQVQSNVEILFGTLQLYPNSG